MTTIMSIRPTRVEFMEQLTAALADLGVPPNNGNGWGFRVGDVGVELRGPHGHGDDGCVQAVVVLTNISRHHTVRRRYTQRISVPFIADKLRSALVMQAEQIKAHEAYKAREVAEGERQLIALAPVQAAADEVPPSENWGAANQPAYVRGVKAFYQGPEREYRFGFEVGLVTEAQARAIIAIVKG